MAMANAPQVSRYQSNPLDWNPGPWFGASSFSANQPSAW